MFKMFKKLTALIISLAMVVGAIQFNAVGVFADTTVTTTGGLTIYTQDSGGIDYDDTTGLVTISQGGEYIVSGSTDTETIKITGAASDVYIILDNASITSSTAAPIEIDCDAFVCIYLLGDNSLISNSNDQSYPGENYAGIQKTSFNNNLEINNYNAGTLNCTQKVGLKLTVMV